MKKLLDSPRNDNPYIKINVLLSFIFEIKFTSVKVLSISLHTQWIQVHNAQPPHP